MKEQVVVDNWTLVTEVVEITTTGIDLVVNFFHTDGAGNFGGGLNDIIYIDNISFLAPTSKIEMISYVNIYDDSIVTESIFIEQSQFIFVFDVAYTTEIVEVRSELHLGIFDNVLANEYIYGVIPGGKEIFTDLYINNKIRKAMKVPLMEVEASISVNKIVRKNIGL